METKFDEPDLEALREQLLHMRSDYETLTEVIQAFAGRLGYGISPQAARQAAVQFAASTHSLDDIRTALDGVALPA